MLLIVLVVVIGVVTTGILLVITIGLVRHVKLLARSVAEFQEQVQPLLEEISRGGSRATDRIQGLSEGRPRRGPSASIRR